MESTSGFLRLIQLLSMTVWVGGLVFFAFVLAPTAFQVLPVHEAGLVVGAALRVFDVVSLAWGVLFLVATWTLFRHKPVSACRLCRIQFLLALVMVVATAFLHWGVVGSMERDRAIAGGDIATLAPDDFTRIHFNVLHKLSEGIAGAILLLGICVLFLISRQMTPRELAPTTES